MLRGRRSAPTPPLRPPWSLEESLFTQHCTRCGDCIDVCETAILVKGDGGFPTVDFARGECTFCQGCLSHCETGALNAAITPPWNIKAGINAQCLTQQQVVCRSCADLCETRAIRFDPLAGGVASPRIEADQCTGCGACVSVCPSHAINLSNPEHPTDPDQGAPHHARTR
ncbi:ferredoxin-type protein NapF [Aestuariirhabdus litorea]|uniref:ferredoxin-type protein NapF n=1 Tax=Aestuariirhabdus litorea TaxID=2528527 RepID=UPI001A9FA8CC|nr:ferredoxin-type protein NapF [Aestuariirhabdus litorea]